MIYLILSIIALIWCGFGIHWILKYDTNKVFNPLDYTVGTIFLGGPVWWVITLTEYIAKIPFNFNLPKPEKKK